MSVVNGPTSFLGGVASLATDGADSGAIFGDSSFFSGAISVVLAAGVAGTASAVFSAVISTDFSTDFSTDAVGACSSDSLACFLVFVSSGASRFFSRLSRISPAS